jgi:hypothetical protein
VPQPSLTRACDDELVVDDEPFLDAEITDPWADAERPAREAAAGETEGLPDGIPDAGGRDQRGRDQALGDTIPRDKR